MALSNLTPVTRPEAILDGTDRAPVTRREYFMKKAATSGGAFYINISEGEGDTLTADQTFADIMAAYNAGSVLIGVITDSNMLAELIDDDPDNGVVQFSTIDVDSTGVSKTTFYINSDDTVTSETSEYPST